MRALLTVALVALLACPVPADTDRDEHDADPEEEGDTAPFVVLVEDGDGRRCGASLVSLRTALTAAPCVRDAAALWVSAPGAEGVRRRVARVATAVRAEGAGPALLELEAALGGGARPILMATRGDECAPSAACHVVRTLGPRLRIVDATLVGAERCAPDAPLCLAGPTLCAEDRGAGVVCEGKLCGVLGPAAGGASDRCGTTRAAQSVTRWRRFLHCAHTLRACGRSHPFTFIICPYTTYRLTPNRFYSFVSIPTSS